MAPVSAYDLHYIKYTDDFQSFVDLSVIGLIIYVTTEIYLALFKVNDEVNLSIVWCGMILIYGLATLSSIALNYLRTSEASLLYVFAAVSFITSMIAQLADGKLFDFHLKEAFRNVTTSTLTAIQNHFDMLASVDSGAASDTADASKSSNYVPRTTPQRIYSQIKTYSTNELLFTCFIATVSAFIGAILFFPSFRLARLHYLCLKYSQGSKLKRFLFYSNFLLPFLVTLCWFHVTSSPSSKAGGKVQVANENNVTMINQFITMIMPSKSENSSSTVYMRQAGQVVTNILMADNLKMYLIIGVFLLRISLYRFYAQSYLNLAFELATTLRKSASKITNVQYMKSVSSIYQYYGVVASQYVIPLFVVLYFGLLLKTLGDYSWCGDAGWCHELVNSISSYLMSFKSSNNGSTVSTSLLKQFETKNFNLTMGHNALNQIFTPLVLRSLIGYFTFWTVSIWFLISCFGLLYYHYIDRQYIVLEQ